MNILTFDVEEWYLEKKYHGDRTERYCEFDNYLNSILALLDRKDIKATFFCLGKLATDFPHVVKTIAEKGHEIGCHSDSHGWLNKMNEQEALEDTRIAVDALEQCIGQKVKSYRAPAFSIGENNKWTFEVLSKCGIERDASVFPASRDFGGFQQFKENVPTLISYRGTVIKEFPIPTAKLFGKELAYSGGGYFRFFPLWFIKNQMRNRDYNMTYFHIGDLLPEARKFQSRQEYETYFKETGTLLNRSKRYVKGNLGKKKAFVKLQHLVESTDFVSLEKSDTLIDWSNANCVNLK